MEKNLNLVGLWVSLVNALIEAYCKKYPDEYCLNDHMLGFDIDGNIFNSMGDGVEETLEWVIEDVIPDLLWKKTPEEGGRKWTDTERLIMGDVLRHLKNEGCNGWLPLLREVAERSGLDAING